MQKSELAPDLEVIVEQSVALRLTDRPRWVDLCLAIVLFSTVTSALFVGLCGLAREMTGQCRVTDFNEGFCAWLSGVLRAAHTTLLMRSEGDKSLMLVALISACASAIPLTLAICPLVFRLIPGQSIVLGRRSIKFPWQFYRDLNWRSTRLWSDLDSVTDVTAGADNKVPRLLELKFRSGGRALVDLSSLSVPDGKVLLAAIDELATDCEITPQLQPSLTGTNGTASVRQRLSYTKIWEESLAASLSSTVFVPLAAGSFLLRGRLRIVRQLASTPWSATYLGRISERKLVIVKESIVPCGSEASVKAAQLFDRECKVLSRLSHARISRVCDHFMESGRRYLVLEYFPGCDLRETLRRRGPMNESAVLTIALELCSALEYLHAQEPPVIHRDVTPDNIILDDDGTVRLVDFGASKYFYANATGTLVGKQSYIAPEQLRGKPLVQSDIYALGATMYTLLTGVEPTPLSECNLSGHRASSRLCELIASMTRFEASERPQSIFEVKAKLEAIESGRQLVQAV